MPRIVVSRVPKRTKKVRFSDHVTVHIVPRGGREMDPAVAARLAGLRAPPPPPVTTAGRQRPRS